MRAVKGNMIYANLALALSHFAFLVTSAVRAAVLSLRAAMRRSSRTSKSRISGELDTVTTDAESVEKGAEVAKDQEEGEAKTSGEAEGAMDTEDSTKSGSGKAKAVAKQLFGKPVVA